jgi:hypothetical protein
MKRAIFGMINNDKRPVGGIKVIFQAVGGLRRAGVDACILSEKSIPSWLQDNALAADAVILDANQPQRIDLTDLYVATDSFGAHRRELLLSRGKRAVIFFQNHTALRANTEINWAEFVETPCIAVSHFTARALAEAGFKDVTVISPGIDPAVFKPARHKVHQLCFMSRKWPQITTALQRQFGQKVRLVEIDGQPEAKVAEIMATSTIFVGLGRNEGLGLPPLEAMAAGCLLCGFAAEGTLDYARPENGFWAKEGDIEGCMAAVSSAMQTVSNDKTRYQSMLNAGLKTAQDYALTAFTKNMNAYIQSRL